MPPAQCVAGGMRRGVGEDREDEALGVPERVAVVTRARQALRRDRTLLRARAGLERVEEGETDRLLELGIAVEFDVGAAPELIEVRALLREQPLPAGVTRLGQRRDDLVPQGRI